MISDGYLVGDGSWQLKIFVTDLKVERALRVKGDLHVGGVMLKLVEELGNYGQTLIFYWVFNYFSLIIKKMWPSIGRITPCGGPRKTCG